MTIMKKLHEAYNIGDKVGKMTGNAAAHEVGEKHPRRGRRVRR